ncbi:hypothetical protein Tco_0865244 [Tanacetum coccineum]
MRQTIDQSAGGKLRDRNAKESWALLEDLALYDNESWNDPRDFAKPVKAISLPQDVPSTSDRRLIELENQVQRLLEAHRAPKQPVQVNKVTSSRKICSGPHDTQYCMENPEQTFVDYASSRTDESEEEEEKGNPENVNTTLPSPPDLSILFITEKVHILNSFFESSGLVPRSSDIKFVCTKEDDGDVMFIEIIKKYDDSREEELEEDENAITGGLRVEYFDIFPTRSELAYHKMVHVEKAYIDLNSPLNIMTRMLYNCIMKRKLDPREDPIRGISNFTGRIKGMRIFVGNFTYISDFMIVEDISSIIDPRLLQVVLWKPFVKISNMTHDISLGVVRFMNGIDELAYKMPYKIEQYNSLSDLKKEYTKSVYFRNKEDKRRGVDYVMSMILGFYKECLKL